MPVGSSNHCLDYTNCNPNPDSGSQDINPHSGRTELDVVIVSRTNAGDIPVSLGDLSDVINFAPTFKGGLDQD